MKLLPEGLTQLGINREAVDVEILDSGSKGLFGLGGRQAQSAPGFERPGKKLLSICSSLQTPPTSPAKTSVDSRYPGDEDAVLPCLPRNGDRDLLEKMKVFAQVTAHYTEPEEPGDETTGIGGYQWR